MLSKQFMYGVAFMAGALIMLVGMGMAEVGLFFGDGEIKVHTTQPVEDWNVSLQQLQEFLPQLIDFEISGEQRIFTFNENPQGERQANRLRVILEDIEDSDGRRVIVVDGQAQICDQEWRWNAQLNANINICV